MGPYQRTPKQVARAIRYSGSGVRSVGPVGCFLKYHNSLESSLGEQEKKLLVNTFIYCKYIIYLLCMHCACIYIEAWVSSQCIYIYIFLHVHCKF